MVLGGLVSGATNLVKQRIHALIDNEVTKKITPFLEVGEYKGEPCSDFVVNEDSDISLENMILKTSVVNESLQKANVPFRVSLCCAKRIFFDIPWGNLLSAEAQWRLELHGLQIILQPLEWYDWDVEDLRKAKEASIEGALAALIKKLKALDAKPPSGFVETIKRRLMSAINVTVHISNVHVRLERLHGEGVGAPPFSLGFILPAMDVVTSLANEAMETSVTIERAGIYCRAGLLNGLTRAESYVPNGQPPPSPAKEGEKSKEAIAAAQDAVFARVEMMRAKMDALAKESRNWPQSEWFVICAPEVKPGGSKLIDPAFCRIKVRQDNKSKSTPSKFKYEQPVQVTSVSIGKASIQASEAQLAALLSIPAHGSNYKLWAAYGVAHNTMGLPKDGTKIPPRLLWKAAARAVISSLHKEKLGAGNIAAILKQAKAYKAYYVDLLQFGLTSAGVSTKFLAKDVRNARAKCKPALKKELNNLEDVLPVGTIAWCRLVSQKHVAEKKGVKDDDGDGHVDVEENSDLMRLQDEQAKSLSDGRLENAPTGYVKSVVDFQLEAFKLQLLRSLNPVEQAELPANAKMQDKRGVELMSLDIKDIRARIRSVMKVGSRMALYIASIDATDCTTPGKPLFVNLAGKAPSEPDEMLGGSVEFPGEIGEELEKRRIDSSGIARRLAARAYNKIGGSPRSKGGDDDGAVAEIADIAMPVVLVNTLTTSDETVPNELLVKLGYGEIVYYPPFWVDLEAFFQPLEAVKWSSQLGGTEKLRVRHGRIYRAIDKLMREGWHTPQIKIMTPFLELSDMMGIPSWKHILSVGLAGLRFTLMSEKDLKEELMDCHIPPMEITKSPKVGDPLPDKQTFALKFHAPVRAESAVQKGLFARTVAIATNGGPYRALSRLHGTRDTLAGEVKALNSQIAALTLEVERLNVAKAAVGSQVLTSKLENSKEFRAHYAQSRLVQSMPELTEAGAPAPSASYGLPFVAERQQQAISAQLAELNERMEVVHTYVALKSKRGSTLRRMFGGRRNYDEESSVILTSPKKGPDVRRNLSVSAPPRATQEVEVEIRRRSAA